MHSKIAPNKSVYISLYYNEQKVSVGKAERIGAENFLKDHDRLTSAEILARFRQRSSYNEGRPEFGVHFSLNFGKVEEIDKVKLGQIADRYMAGMGFEDQPYVVYQHKDAGHTHLHVVATRVRADGSLIRLEPKDYFESQCLCRELEREFVLEKKLKSTESDQYRYAVDHAQKVSYGEPGLKRALSDVLNTVVDHYQYTSLDEYNAVLKQYNVEANPGLPDSHLRKVGGLLYHSLDDNGDRIGVPIKASEFLLKPTLKRLEQKFEQNQSLRESSREHLHTSIEWALAGRAPSWTEFTDSLEKEGIAIVTTKKEGGKDQLFFVDHAGKSVFAAENIAPDYDLQALQIRCIPEEQVIQQQLQKQQHNLHL
jgi:hypothetical protein